MGFKKERRTMVIEKPNTKATREKSRNSPELVENKHRKYPPTLAEMKRKSQIRVTIFLLYALRISQSMQYQKADATPTPKQAKKVNGCVET